MYVVSLDYGRVRVVFQFHEDTSIRLNRLPSRISTAALKSRQLFLCRVGEQSERRRTVALSDSARSVA